jgi:hypothetical protein
MSKTFINMVVIFSNNQRPLSMFDDVLNYIKIFQMERKTCQMSSIYLYDSFKYENNSSCKMNH